MTKLTKKVFLPLYSHSFLSIRIQGNISLYKQSITRKNYNVNTIKNLLFFTYNKNSKQFVWNFYVNILLTELCFTKTQASYSEKVSVVLMITENLRLFFISSLPAE